MVWEERWHPLRREWVVLAGVVSGTAPEGRAAERLAVPAVHYERAAAAGSP
jgi:hypothetical protein